MQKRAPSRLPRGFRCQKLFLTIGLHSKRLVSKVVLVSLITSLLGAFPANAILTTDVPQITLNLAKPELPRKTQKILVKLPGVTPCNVGYALYSTISKSYIDIIGNGMDDETSFELIVEYDLKIEKQYYPSSVRVKVDCTDFPIVTTNLKYLGSFLGGPAPKQVSKTSTKPVPSLIGKTCAPVGATFKEKNKTLSCVSIGRKKVWAQTGNQGSDAGSTAGASEQTQTPAKESNCNSTRGGLIYVEDQITSGMRGFNYEIRNPSECNISGNVSGYLLCASNAYGQQQIVVNIPLSISKQSFASLNTNTSFVSADLECRRLTGGKYVLNFDRPLNFLVSSSTP